MEITQEILTKGKEMIGNLLNKHQNGINQAFIQMDETLDINAKIRLSLNKGKFKIQSDVSFTAEKVKDNSIVWYDPNQKELPFSEEPPEEPE